MTLQELHELTGKVLKQRPELAELTTRIDSNYTATIEAMSVYDNEVWVCDYIDDIDSEEILWQAN